jgi:hypothetical protein
VLAWSRTKGTSYPYPLVPVLGSIANAVYDAVGVRMIELPITQQKILEALERKRGGGE